MANVTGHRYRDHDSRGEKYSHRMIAQAKRDREDVEAVNRRAAETFEGTIDLEDFLHLDYFAKGLAAARCVGRIDGLSGLFLGTGFICAPGFVMTNNHVIPSPKYAEYGIDIGFETYDQRVEVDKCRLDPERFFFTSKQSDLDCTIIAMEEELGAKLSEALGWHGIKAEQGKIALGKPTSVIQYPKGQGKRLVVHNSMLIEIAELDEASDDWRRNTRLWYTSDTASGSSGSPVFNRNFEVIALHHAGIPMRENGKYVDRHGNPMEDDDFDADPDRAAFRANQGIRASCIAKALENEFKGAPTQMKIKDKILDAWSNRNGQAAVLREMRQRVLLTPSLASTGLEMPEGSRRGLRSRSADGVLFEEIARRLQDGTMRIQFRDGG
ncbi:serine protease [uncultured Limimaricola sp.]|uniref:trypsin-like serine peptidase n=1 Tax=uncultured Limimaricola sp. TaxID=2211667 RepID=UPI0030F82E80